MNDVLSPALSAWDNFYVMTGSSAAALTGLMFVVITLVDSRQVQRNEGISVFSTPTVVHLSAALLVSAVMSAPWRSPAPVSVILGLIGLAGMVYMVVLFSRQIRLRNYQPDWEDWSWYTVLPIIAYGTMLGGAIAMHTAVAPALFAVGGSVILLMFIGIHNAWDIVTFLATGQAERLSADVAKADAEKKDGP